MFRKIAAALLFVTLTSPASAQTEMRFAIDGPLNGSSAPYVFADDTGLFEAEGLDIEVRPTRSALDVVNRVGLGTYPFGVTDFPTFAEYIIMNPGSPVVALMVMHDRSAYTVIGLKSHGITTMSDLAGHIVAHDSNSFAKFRLINVASSNNLNMADITLKHREPTEIAAALAAGEVDAVVGLSYDLLPDLARLGVSADDLTILPMADNGLELYGQALVINTSFLAKSSGTATKLLAVVLQAWKASIADPDLAIAALVARNPELDPALEAERLRMIIAENVLTPWVLENGFGTTWQARQEWNVAQLQDNPAFINSEDRDTFFNMNFLPGPKDRAMQ